VARSNRAKPFQNIFIQNKFELVDRFSNAGVKTFRGGSTLEFESKNLETSFPGKSNTVLKLLMVPLFESPSFCSISAFEIDHSKNDQNGIVSNRKVQLSVVQNKTCIELPTEFYMFLGSPSGRKVNPQIEMRFPTIVWVKLKNPDSSFIFSNRSRKTYWSRDFFILWNGKNSEWAEWRNVQK